MFLLLGADERGLLDVEVSPDDEPLPDSRCFSCSAATRCFGGPAMVKVNDECYGWDVKWS